MDISGVKKEPGCSWIEMNNEIHIFIAKDIAHCDFTHIFSFRQFASTDQRVWLCGKH